jgi:hypothetical protein
VRFTLFHDGENVPAQIIETQTAQGIARANFVIDQSGEINIQAESGSAVTSDILTFEIPPEAITSTPPIPTQTPTPTLTPTIVPTITPTATPQATPIPAKVPSQGNLDFGDWLVALIVIVIISGADYWLINMKSGLRWGVRGALLPMISGMITYIYLAINMPGSESLLNQMGTWGVLLIVIIGAGIGVGAIWIWQMMDLRHIKPA